MFDSGIGLEQACGGYASLFFLLKEKLLEFEIAQY